VLTPPEVSVNVDGHGGFMESLRDKEYIPHQILASKEKGKHINDFPLILHNGDFWGFDSRTWPDLGVYNTSGTRASLDKKKTKRFLGKPHVSSIGKKDLEGACSQTFLMSIKRIGIYHVVNVPHWLREIVFQRITPDTL